MRTAKLRTLTAKASILASRVRTMRGHHFASIQKNVAKRSSFACICNFQTLLPIFLWSSGKCKASSIYNFINKVAREVIQWCISLCFDIAAWGLTIQSYSCRPCWNITFPRPTVEWAKLTVGLGKNTINLICQIGLWRNSFFLRKAKGGMTTELPSYWLCWKITSSHPMV